MGRGRARAVGLLPLLLLVGACSDRDAATVDAAQRPAGTGEAVETFQRFVVALADGDDTTASELSHQGRVGVPRYASSRGDERSSAEEILAAARADDLLVFDWSAPLGIEAVHVVGPTINPHGWWWPEAVVLEATLGDLELDVTVVVEDERSTVFRVTDRRLRAVADRGAQLTPWFDDALLCPDVPLFVHAQQTCPVDDGDRAPDVQSRIAELEAAAIEEPANAEVYAAEIATLESLSTTDARVCQIMQGFAPASGADSAADLKARAEQLVVSLCPGDPATFG